MRHLVVLLIFCVATGCDPCAGIGVCGGPYVRFEGDVLKAYPEAPATGVRVEFVRSGGVFLENDVIVGQSDSEGRFQLEGDARDNGEVVGNLTFYPPDPIPPIRFEGVRIKTTRTPGQLLFGGSWKIPYPHLPYEAHFFALGNNAPIRGMEIEFRRTGGIAVEPDTFRVTTDFAGNVKLRPLTNQNGDLFGELVVYPIPPYQSFVVPNLKLSTQVVQRFDSTLVKVGIGRSLPYAGVLVWEDTGLPARGFELEFRRLGGVPIHPDPFVIVPDTFGTFHVTPVPLANGFVDGQLIIRSPAAYAGFVLRNLRMPVYERQATTQNMGAFRVPRIVGSQ